MSINTSLITKILPILANSKSSNAIMGLSEFCDVVKGGGCANCKYQDFCKIADSAELDEYLHKYHPELFI